MSSEEEEMTSVHILAHNIEAIIASGTKYDSVFLFDEECTDEELDAICRLARVELRFQFHRIAEHLNMRVIAKAIRGSTLKILGVQQCLLTADQIIIFASVLPSMPKLKTLIMSSDSITDAAIPELARVIPQCPRLSNLNLESNPGITDAGALELARVIPQCPRLSDLNLDLNRGITDVGARAIVNALNARHTLTVPYMGFYGLTNVSPETVRSHLWGRGIRREIPRVLALYGTGRTPAQTWAEWRDGDHAMMYRVLGFLL